ncbi:MAG: helicase HerA-like domain-containing protein [Pseudomonadota bacterium]
MTHPIPDEAMNAHIAILGTTGGGKSYTARGLVERLLDAERRVCILDPVGVWWGLRSNAEGDGPGYPVAVVGGEHGDLALSEASAKPLAWLVAQNNLPMVVDTQNMRVGERTRFLTDFLEELYRVNRGALWVVLEEADEAAPQKPVNPGAAILVSAVQQLAQRGRSKGFRLVLISQRPQVINKTVLNQTRTLVSHRLFWPLDIKAVEDVVKANSDGSQVAEIRSSLPELETGEAWVWSPEHKILARTQMPQIQTFDSSATPDADEEPIQPTDLAHVDLSALQALEQPQEPAEPHAVAQPDPKALQTAEKRGYDQGYADGLRDGEQKAVARLREAIAPVLGGMDSKRQAPNPEPSQTPTKPKTKVICAIEKQEIENLKPKARAVLEAVIAAGRPIRYEVAATRAGVSKRSSQYRAYARGLIACGLVREEVDGLVPAGAALDLVPPPPEGLDGWIARLKPSEGAILRSLSVLPGLDRQGVAEHAGISPTSSGLGNALRELKALELIREDAGSYYLCDALT